MPSPLLLHAEPTPPAAARPGGNRRWDIQGLRGVALLMILGYHAGLPIPGGFVCVDVFFVISGFVITGMLQREWAATGRVRFRAFYVRRFKRLVPSLAVVVTVTMLLSVLLLSPFGGQQTAAKTGIGALSLIANVVIATTSGGYFDAPALGNPLLTTWSLSVEEQFYLVFPAILVLSWVFARRRRRLRAAPWVIVIAISALSFALSVVGSVGIAVSSANWLWLFGYYSSITRGWEFAVGALLALAGSRLSVSSKRVALLLGLLGAAILVASMALLDGSVRFPGPLTVAPVLAAVLLLVAGTQKANLVTRTLATRPLVHLGDWSYSVYLWHWPLIVFASAIWPGNHPAVVVAAAVSFIPALACYRWVEQPLRTFPALTRPALARFVTIIVAAPVVASGLLLLGANLGWGQPVIQQAGDQETAAHIGWLDCMSQAGSGGPGPLNPGSCAFNSTAAGGAVYLVGDSSASMYTEAAVGAVTDLDRELTVSTAGGCPFIDVYRGTLAGASTADAACRAYYETAMADLLTRPPGVVLIAEGAGYWSTPGLTVGSAPGSLQRDPAKRSSALEAGLRRTVTTLHGAGHRVVLILPTLAFDDPSTPVTAQSCSLWSILLGRCPDTVAVTRADPHQVQARADVARVARDSGAASIDVLGYQCPSGRCGQYYQGVPVYMDTAHLAAPLSRLLAPEFSRAIAAAG